jgi:hypothetical protein
MVDVVGADVAHDFDRAVIAPVLLLLAYQVAMGTGWADVVVQCRQGAEITVRKPLETKLVEGLSELGWALGAVDVHAEKCEKHKNVLVFSFTVTERFFE